MLWQLITLGRSQTFEDEDDDEYEDDVP